MLFLDFDLKTYHVAVKAVSSWHPTDPRLHEWGNGCHCQPHWDHILSPSTLWQSSGVRNEQHKTAGSVLWRFWRLSHPPKQRGFGARTPLDHVLTSCRKMAKRKANWSSGGNFGCQTFFPLLIKRCGLEKEKLARSCLKYRERYRFQSVHIGLYTYNSGYVVIGIRPLFLTVT